MKNLFLLFLPLAFLLHSCKQNELDKKLDNFEKIVNGAMDTNAKWMSVNDTDFVDVRIDPIDPNIVRRDTIVNFSKEKKGLFANSEALEIDRGTVVSVKNELFYYPYKDQLRGLDSLQNKMTEEQKKKFLQLKKDFENLLNPPE